MGQSRQRQGIVVAAAVVALLASFAVPSDSYAIGGDRPGKMTVRRAEQHAGCAWELRHSPRGRKSYGSSVRATARP